MSAASTSIVAAQSTATASASAATAAAANPSATLFSATSKYSMTTCDNDRLSLISYQFQQTCQQQSASNSTTTVTSAPCTSSNGYSQRLDCFSDYSAFGAAKFGTAAYAELVIYNGPDCKNKANIVGVRHYALNQQFEWSNSNGVILTGINSYDPSNPSKILVGQCKDSLCKSVLPNLHDSFPIDATTCYKPVNLFNAGTFVRATLYNRGVAVRAPVNGYPVVATSGGGAAAAGKAVWSVVVLVGVLVSFM
ncbi:hypothetical protein CcCBS67573_g04302 [Chytriomyces confervae]|uniref:Uncharacterized protein n=1 Tax=Chytriomyces confervae TaxID=246404 RepID=A0A507FDL3_9FUNG|nr:hypothetical protein HDU80_005982 [Chytriomyces hyalinus]TPX74431.1 hypothetical protein CcCBS67573_g04302 [Chytriomyces confervae]